MAINFKHRPARSAETHHLVRAVRQGYLAINGDVVVVPQHDQLAQFVTSGQTNGLLGNTLHQATVASNHIGVVIDHLLAVTRALDFLGNGKADRIGDALTQRAGGGFNPFHMAVLRMACRACAPLAEILDLVQRDLFIARQIQQRINQHRAMTGGQDKPVAIGPMRGLGVKLQVFFKQYCGNIGHAHRHPRVAGICRCNSVQRQGADGGGLHPVIGVVFAQSLNIHGGLSLSGAKLTPW